jgi:HEAT repeat protein
MILRPVGIVICCAVAAAACGRGVKSAPDAAPAPIPATPVDVATVPAPDAVAASSPTAALISDPALQVEVDALAAFGRVESAAVGVAGAPSEVWQAHEKLAVKLSREQLTALLAHPSPVVRCYMGRALVARFPDAATALAPLLADQALVERRDGCLSDRSTVAAYTAEVLCRSVVDNPAVQELLLATVDEPRAGDVRATLFACVAAVRKEDATAKALALLDGGDAKLRPAAITVLGLTGATEAAERVAALAEDPEPLVRTAVIATLQALGASQAGAVIVDRLSDADVAVRRAAARAYASRVDAERARLERLLADEDFGVQSAAAEGLAAAATVEGLALLGPWLAASAHPEPALRVLESSVASGVAALMRGLLGSERDPQRKRAVAYFLRVRDPDSAAALREALARASSVTEWEDVLRALVQLGDREAIPAIRGYLSHATALLRVDAAAALVALGDREAIPAVEAAVAATDDSEMKAALQQHLEALRALPLP